MRSILIAVLLALSALSATPTAAQTDFPNRRIHIVLPYPAGGIVDILTRILADKLSEIWGQPIVVEPKPGANGNLAWDQVSRTEPDGYTWTFVAPALTANPRMQAGLRWSEQSFVPIAAAVWAPSVIVVHPSVPARTVAELIDHAKKNAGVLNWANPGTGTSQHLNAAIFFNHTKVEMTAVPYRGQPPGILDLMAGRVHMKVASVGLVAEHVNSGALRALAVLGTTRSPLLPDVPTMSEAGFPEVNVVPWYGYAAPKGTPPAVVDKIVAGFQVALADPKVRELLAKQALQPIEPMSAAQIAALLGRDAEAYGKVIREAGIKLGE
jgi:tripartite-type tricarboxylate transporter receptor subunit TctC